MDQKELVTNSSVSTCISDGSSKFTLNSPTLPSNRNKSYDVGSNSMGKVEASAARPCAIIGPDRVLPSTPDDTMYLKKMPGEAWPPPENVYRHPPDYPSKVSDYQPTRNISPRQTFQENMQRIMVPPTFSSMKSSEVPNLKNNKLNMPQEAKYCDVPYNINSVNSEHKSVRNSDISMSNMNPYSRNMPPSYGWPTAVNIRPLRPYGAPEFYQYQEFPSCAGPRPMTMIRPHRALHEESAQVYSERLYQDANIRFKPYPTGKEKHQQQRYDYVSNYPNSFHPPATLPPHKYDLPHSYPVYPPVPFKCLDRRIHEPFADGYHRSHSQQANFNAFHGQVVPPPYGPIPGNCMQNKTYTDASIKPLNVNKFQYENNNKVYINLESRNKNNSVPENLYYNNLNHPQTMRGEILLPTHSTLKIPPMNSIYRKDTTPLKSYDYNSNYRIFDQSININHSLQQLPVQFSPNSLPISPDSNTSNDTAQTIGTSQEDCGYVSQSSTASIRSFDSSNIPMSHDVYRRHSFNNYDMVRHTFLPVGPGQIPKNKTSSSNKKNLNVRQFLQMWNEGEEEVSEANKEAAGQNHTKKICSQSEIINNQEQLYVLGLVNVPNEELGKYDHIQKISKLPENIKGYNSIEILNQYEELLETPHISNYNRSRDYAFSKSQINKDITTKMLRPVSPLDVEAKISQSVIHKEVGCNFEIKPCSPEMLNVEIAAPVQNILGERIIEKVVNPNVPKSPNVKGENIKLQNTVIDTVNVASCKMISDQYSLRNTPNRTKPSNYSMQDLERNAGLCLASLPQLDNDIELNFPEINQQFIKANQIETNNIACLQNLPDMNLEQTHRCLPHETTNDSQHQNLSPHTGLGTSVDKEFSKLSKYRKGKKNELNTLNSTQKPDAINTVESMVLQRIDSVIIKNPDTNKLHENESEKLISETNYSFQKETTESSYSSSEYQRHIDTHDLSSDTAIDFSLSRSEEETAVRFLSAIDGNIHQNLPLLEEFDEESLNEGENMSLTSPNFEKQNNLPKSTTPPPEILQDSQEEISTSTMTVKFVNNEHMNQEIDKDNDNSMRKVPVKSPELNSAQEECIVVMKNATMVKLTLPEVDNIPVPDNANNIKTSEIDIQAKFNECQENIEILTNPKDTSLSRLVEPVIDKDVDRCINSLKKEIVSNDMSEVSFDTKRLNDKHIENQTIEEVLKDLSNRDIDNSKTSSFQNSSDEDVKTLNNFVIRNEEGSKIESDLSLVLDSKKETVDLVLQNPDVGNTRTKGLDQPINSKLKVKYDENPAAAFQQGPRKELKSNPDIDFQDLEKSDESTMPIILMSPKNQQDVKMKGDEFKLHCKPDEKNIFSCGKTVRPMVAETVIEENKNQLIQSDYVQKLNMNNIDYLSNASDSYTKDSQVGIPILDNETKTLLNSTEEYEECRKTEKFTLSLQPKKNYKTNLDAVESACSYNNDDVIYDKNIDEKNIEESSIVLNKSVLENLNSKVTECKQKLNIDLVKLELKSETCMTANTVEESLLYIESNTAGKNSHLQVNCYKTNELNESCLSTKNMKNSENPIITEESRHEIEIDNKVLINFESHMDLATSKSQLLSHELSYIKSIQPVKESELLSENKNPNKSIQDTNINSIQMDFQKSIKEAESECLSNIESTENVVGYCEPLDTFSKSSVPETAKSKKIIDTQNENYVNVSKFNISDPDMVDNTSKFKNETDVVICENKGLVPWKYHNQDNVIKIRQTNCGKELFSPRFQNLLMFTEGRLIPTKNESYVKPVDNYCNTIEEKDDRLGNAEVVSSANCGNATNPYDKVYNGFCDASSINDTRDTNEILQTEFVIKQVTHIDVHDKCSLTEEVFKDINKQLSPVAFENSTIVKPQKVSKRSLSESALEAYKNIDDVNYVQHCKRKRGTNNNQNFLESHMITEDICNLIQTNRRNSISTFYNDDNVYIVIDNDLILTEESDSLDKLCYTENSEEFVTTCKENLNIESNRPNSVCDYSDSLQLSEDIEDSWVDNVACVETVFSEDVAENIIIDVHASPKQINSSDLESENEESNVFYDSDHIDKLKSIYGGTICTNNTQLIETLYRTPQMNVNKTLYHIETQVPEECSDVFNNSRLEADGPINCNVLKSEYSSHKIIDNKENMSENVSLQSVFQQSNQNICPNSNDKDFELDELNAKDKEDKFTSSLCKSSSDYFTSNVQKENSNYSCSSSPEVSSTTSEEKNSSILLKITNCNGSRVSQINNVNSDIQSKLSYKLTEEREYRSYNSTFGSSRTLVTKAAQKYIPPLKKTIYDLKVKLHLPQHRLHTLKQLKIAKVEPKKNTIANICATKNLNHEVSKKIKPKFEDVLKSIDEVNFKRHKSSIKRKSSIPKVIIKKNEKGAHYTSNKTVNRKEIYNPDLTGRKWQPWVFIEKNNFVDKMALQNKDKAIYCHRKNSYVLLEKFRKYKSIYNADFVISQPKSETKGNLKYTIRLKHN